MSGIDFQRIRLDPDFGSGSPTDLAARQQAAERMERLNRRLELDRIRREQRAKRTKPKTLP